MTGPGRRTIEGRPCPIRPWISRTSRNERGDLGEPRLDTRPPRDLRRLPRAGSTPRRARPRAPRHRARGSGRDTTRRTLARAPPSGGRGRPATGQAAPPGAGRGRPAGNPSGSGRRPRELRQSASIPPRQAGSPRGGCIIPGPSSRWSDSSASALDPGAAPEVLQHPLHGPLTDPDPLADLLARKPAAFSSRMIAPILGQQVVEPIVGLAGLRDLARRLAARPATPPSTRSGASRWMSCFWLAARRYSSITLFLAAQARKAIRFRSSSRSFGPVRIRRKKLPQTLWRKSSESNRDRKSRGNCRRTTSADFRLVAGQQLPGGLLVAVLDPGDQLPNVGWIFSVRFLGRHCCSSLNNLPRLGHRDRVVWVKLAEEPPSLPVDGDWVIHHGQGSLIRALVPCDHPGQWLAALAGSAAGSRLRRSIRPGVRAPSTPDHATIQ